MYQSIQAVNIPLGRPLGNFFERVKSPPPGQKRLQNQSTQGKKIICEKALKPHPWDKTITQALAETYEVVLITQIFDNFLIQKGISNTLFGSICFKNNSTYYFCINLIQMFQERNVITVKENICFSCHSQ